MAVSEIDVEQLQSELAAVTLIDVRRPEEYESGHVPGARLITLTDVPDYLVELRNAGPLHIICASGGRSMSASEFLDSEGIGCTNITGGTKAWIDAGFPVVSGPNPS
jgi:rhodanese-related sulfurtransferase